jgi:hypothetical protein
VFFEFGFHCRKLPLGSYLERHSSMLNEAIDGLFRRFSYEAQNYMVFRRLIKKKATRLSGFSL